MRMSLTSVANSGCKEPSTYANLVCCWVILRVRNCASTCSNQSARSFGQNGGNFKVIRAGCVDKLALMDVPGMESSVVSMV